MGGDKKYYGLAGDIGGTNCRLALYKDDGDDKSEALFLNYYRNETYVKEYAKSAFVTILKEFLNECVKKEVLDAGCLTGEDNVVVVAGFACAGPIKDNTVEFTNLQEAFVIEGDTIASSKDGPLGCIKAVKLVNDFVGQGYGALGLDLATECVELTPGSEKLINPLGPKVCVGAGTGLGECFLTISSANPDWGYECFPSEGGHVEFNPRSDLEVELRADLMKKFPGNDGKRTRISVERVVSGKGIANVYEFLSKKLPEEVDAAVHAEFLEAGDMQGKVVSVNAKPGTLCNKAMEIFATAYGAEVGCAALKWIPTGGLYVTGGITGKLIEKSPHYLVGPEAPFMKAFHDKGRVAKLLLDIPLFAVKSEDLGLRGARFVAMRELRSFK